MTGETTAGIIINEMAEEQQAKTNQDAAQEQIEQGAVTNKSIRSRVQNDRAKRLR